MGMKDISLCSNEGVHSIQGPTLLIKIQGVGALHSSCRGGIWVDRKFTHSVTLGFLSTTKSNNTQKLFRNQQN